jgi:uncharacterized protein YigA (DUF484 family)
MSDAGALTGEMIATWLQQNPHFFNDYSDFLQEITVVHPYAGKAISLAERQLIQLRDRIKRLEQQSSIMVASARDNQQIADKLLLWVRALLMESNPFELPDTLLNTLAANYNVPRIALRLWQVAPQFSTLAVAETVAPAIRTWANQLQLSDAFVGSVEEPHFCPTVLSLFAESGTQSVAAMPLTMATAAGIQTFGILLFGASDSQRYQRGMGTLFLDQISAIASAALLRLCPSTSSSVPAHPS